LRYKGIIGVCGSSRVDREGAQRAEQVGRLIAKSGWALVCGGLGGVMEAACRGARNAGGVTVGILPGVSRREANPYVDVPVVTGVGHARNLFIVYTAGAVIALPGGAGTMSEVALSLKTRTPVVGLDAWDDIEGVIGASSPREAVDKAIKAASEY